MADVIYRSKVTWLISLLLIFAVDLAAASSCVTLAGVEFSDNFESGSLGSVEVVSDPCADTLSFRITSKVDPINPLDTLAHRSSRWFYFRMCGIKGRLISIEIPENDMQRGVYSYDNNRFERFSDEVIPTRNGSITKRYDRDTIYIAYYTPYTTARNESQLKRWSESPYVRRFQMGKSSMGTPLDAIVISDDPHEGLIPDSDGALHPTREDLNKRVVYIHSRIHPSESPASWHTESFIDQVIEEQGFMDRTAALKSMILYILPMANPDGVREGMSRTNPAGINLEVTYNMPEEQTEQEVKAIKSFLLTLRRSGLQPDISLNMHSQSTPMLTYWVHTAASTDPKYNRRSMLFASLTLDDNPYFKWRNLSYSTLKPYFVEGWLYRKFRGETTALTYETPYSFYDRRPNAEWVTEDNLRDQSRYLLQAIVDILGVAQRDRITIEEPKRSRGYERCRDNERFIYFGGSYLTARRAGERVTYRHDNIPAGEYNIYRWVVIRNMKSQRYGDGEWRFVGSYSQESDGAFTYELKSRMQGEKFDQLQLRLRH